MLSCGHNAVEIYIFTNRSQSKPRCDPISNRLRKYFSIKYLWVTRISNKVFLHLHSLRRTDSVCALTEKPRCTYYRQNIQFLHSLTERNGCISVLLLTNVVVWMLPGSQIQFSPLLRRFKPHNLSSSLSWCCYSASVPPLKESPDFQGRTWELAGFRWLWMSLGSQ